MPTQARVIKISRLQGDAILANTPAQGKHSAAADSCSPEILPVSTRSERRSATLNPTLVTVSSSVPESATGVPLKTRLVRWLIAVLIFGATLYCYYAPYHPHGLCGLGYESLQLACSLAQKGTLSDPFQVMATGPSAHLAPLFPAFVSLLMKWFGESTYAGWALGWAAITMIGIHLALLPFLTRRFGLGFSPGVIAAAVFLLAKIQPYVMWESFYVALLAVVLSWLMHETVAGASSSAKVIVTAVLWAVVLWTNPVPLLVLLPWLAWVVIWTKVPRNQKLALLILPFLIISPWLVRNYRVFGHFIFMRDNLGLELAVSNNSCAAFTFNANEFSQCFQENHPNEGIVEAARVRDLGEYEYNRVRMREAVNWIRRNPDRFFALTGQRLVAFWFPSPTGNPFEARGTPPGILLGWFMVLLSFPGLWLMWKKNREATGILLLWLVLFPPIYYVIQFDLRYRYPILWATFVPAGFFLAELAKGVWHAFRQTS